jgi:hypothetical protein
MAPVLKRFGGGLIEMTQGHAGIPISTIKNLPGEAYGRRPRRRFPIHEEVRYQCLKGSRIFTVGVGKTLEIGSREVRFTTQEALKRGQKIRLAMDWPAMLDDTCRMTLELYGWILRSDKGEAAAKIERYEFRTRGSRIAMIR